MVLLNSLSTPQIVFVLLLCLIISVLVYVSWQYKKAQKHLRELVDVDPDFNFDPMKVMVYTDLDDREIMFTVEELIDDIYIAEPGSSSDFMSGYGDRINGYKASRCREANDDEVEQYCRLIKSVSNG